MMVLGLTVRILVLVGDCRMPVCVVKKAEQSNYCVLTGRRIPRKSTCIIIIKKKDVRPVFAIPYKYYYPYLLLFLSQNTKRVKDIPFASNFLYPENIVKWNDHLQ